MTDRPAPVVPSFAQMAAESHASCTPDPATLQAHLHRLHDIAGSNGMIILHARCGGGAPDILLRITIINRGDRDSSHTTASTWPEILAEAEAIAREIAEREKTP